jgi:hypothetical protein
MAALTILLLLAAWLSTARADWIHADFSDEAGIDSIERFLVITDIKDSTFFGHAIEPMGDINDDGYDDCLICRDEFGQSYTDRNCYIFLGGEPPDSGFNRVLGSMGAEIGGIGDVNGDGFIDFGLALPFPLRTDIHFGGPDMDSIADFSFPLWSRVRGIADIDADGDMELPLANPNTGVVALYDVELNRDTIPEYTLGDTIDLCCIEFGVGDFSGDGHADLAVARNGNFDTAVVRFYWGGPQFDTVADFQITHYPSNDFGRLLTPLGDFNADGADDILISGGANERYGIYFGGPLMDDEIDICINWGVLFPPTTAAPAGDINNDGYPDLMLTYINLTAFIGVLYIYLGGPNADSLVDVYLDEAVIPGGQINFGRELESVGDFNGDGVDDIALFSQTEPAGPPWRSEVNLFAGWDATATDVPYEYSPDMPASFELLQNYPNPFNSTTTLEFALPARSQVSMDIVNTLGQRVKTLLDRSLPAGTYRVSWDGTNDNGQPVASGIYLYRLTTGETVLTKKMTLLK